MSKRGALPIERWWALAIVEDERLLVVRRPDEGLLAKMWCLPLVAIGRDDDPAAIDRAAICEAIGGDAEIVATPTGVTHVFTHRVWELHALRCTVRGAPRMPGVPDDARAWISA